jgi:hypothetical protein
MLRGTTISARSNEAKAQITDLIIVARRTE